MQALKKNPEHHPHVSLKRGPHVFDIDNGIPSLRGVDMGYGVTLFHLIRETFDEARFRRCLEMNRDGRRSGLVSRREVNLFYKTLQELLPGLSRVEAAKAEKTFGTLQEKNASVCAARGMDGSIWIAIYDGCPAISMLVTSASSRYSSEDYPAKLRQVSNIGAWNRVLYASQIFSLYYGADQIDEVVYRTYVTPYNHVAYRKIAIKTALPASSQEFAVHENSRILLLRNNAAVPVPVPEYTLRHRMNKRQELFPRHCFTETDIVQQMKPFFIFRN